MSLNDVDGKHPASMAALQARADALQRERDEARNEVLRMDHAYDAATVRESREKQRADALAAELAALKEPINRQRDQWEEPWRMRVANLKIELAALRAGQAWQPIESAPKDGRTLLLSGGTGSSRRWIRSGYWARRIEIWSIDTVVSLLPPTHWMPLPPSPGAEDRT